MPTVKITRGISFQDAVEYMTGNGVKKHLQPFIERLPATTAEGIVEGFRAGRRARLVSTNLAGSTEGEFIRQFERHARRRPDIKQPVSKIKINFKKGDDLEAHELMELIDDFRERMGLVNCQFLAVQHRDTKHPHLHLVFNKIDYDGRVVGDKFERLAARKWARDAEAKYGLAPTPLRSRRRPMTESEKEKFARTGERPSFAQLQGHVDRAVNDTAENFVARLEEKNVGVMFRFEEKKAVGVSFSFNGVKYAGGDLGGDFNWNGLQSRGVDYQPERDYEKLVAASERAKENFAAQKLVKEYKNRFVDDIDTMSAPPDASIEVAAIDERLDVETDIKKVARLYPAQVEKDRAEEAKNETINPAISSASSEINAAAKTSVDERNDRAESPTEVRVQTSKIHSETIDTAAEDHADLGETSHQKIETIDDAIAINRATKFDAELTPETASESAAKSESNHDSEARFDRPKTSIENEKPATRSSESIVHENAEKESSQPAPFVSRIKWKSNPPGKNHESENAALDSAPSEQSFDETDHDLTSFEAQKQSSKKSVGKPPSFKRERTSSNEKPIGVSDSRSSESDSRASEIDKALERNHQFLFRQKPSLPQAENTETKDSEAKNSAEQTLLNPVSEHADVKDSSVSKAEDIRSTVNSKIDAPISSAPAVDDQIFDDKAEAKPASGSEVDESIRIDSEKKLAAQNRYREVAAEHQKAIDETRHEDFDEAADNARRYADYAAERERERDKSVSPRTTEEIWKRAFRETYRSELELSRERRIERRKNHVRDSISITKILYSESGADETASRRQVEWIIKAPVAEKVAFLMEKTHAAYAVWKEPEDMGRNSLPPRTARLIEFFLERYSESKPHDETIERIEAIAGAQRIDAPKFAGQLDANVWVINNLPDYGRQLSLENFIEKTEADSAKLLQRMQTIQIDETSRMIKEQMQMMNLEMNRAGWQQMEENIRQAARTLSSDQSGASGQDQYMGQEARGSYVSDLDSLHSLLSKGNEDSRRQCVAGLVRAARLEAEKTALEAETEAIRERIVDRDEMSESTMKI